MGRPGTIVGALACQKDSYLRTFQTTVLNCTPLDPKKDVHKAKKGKESANGSATIGEVPLYELELEDTILFPEGGGQVADRGLLIVEGGENDEAKTLVNVLDVQRKNLRAVHIVDKSITAGTNVKIELDWKRRLDHMQQHTGQHLLSAVLEKHGLATLSCKVGDTTSYLEIPRALTEEEMNEIAQEVNDEILNNTAVKIEVPEAVIEEDSLDPKKGILRVVKIGTVGESPCCGTHLSSVGQVKAVSLLEQVKNKKGSSRLYYVTGDRVYKYTEELYDMCKNLMNIFSSSFEELNVKAENAIAEVKRSTQREKKLVKEIATIKGNEMLQEMEKDDSKFYYFYRPESTSEFINVIFDSIKPAVDRKKSTVVLLSDDGAVVIYGKESQSVIDTLKARFSKFKGGKNKTGKFQGKTGPLDGSELKSLLGYLEELHTAE